MEDSNEISRRNFLKGLAGVTGGMLLGSKGRKVEAATLRMLPELGPKLTPEVERRVKSAVIMVGGEYSDSKDDAKRTVKLDASGFHINGDGTILTNPHVVNFAALDYEVSANLTQGEIAKMLHDKKYHKLFRGFRVGHPFLGSIPAELVYADPISDFAVLKYDTERYSGTQGFGWLPIATAKPTSGETLYNFSYSSEFKNLRGKDEINSHRAIYLGQRNENMECAEGIDPLEYHPQTSGGSSGSPMVNNRGEVVAIQAGGADNATKFAPYIQQTIESYGYRYPGLPAVVSGNLPVSALHRAGIHTVISKQ